MRRAALLAPLVLLAACGGSATQVDSMSGLQQALSKAGAPCEGYARQEATIGAVETGSCTIDGQQAYLTLYASQKTHDTAVQAFASLHTGYHVEGARWTVEVPDQALADRIANKLGGKV